MQRLFALGLIAGAMSLAGSEAEACRNCGVRTCIGCGYGGYGYGGYGLAGYGYGSAYGYGAGYGYGNYYSGGYGWGGWGYGSGFGNASLYGYAGNSGYSYGWPYSYGTYYRPAYVRSYGLPYYRPDFGSYTLNSATYGGYESSIYGYPVGYPVTTPYSTGYRGWGAPYCDTCSATADATAPCDNCNGVTTPGAAAPQATPTTPMPPVPNQGPALQEAPAPGPEATPIEKRTPPAPQPKSAAVPQFRSPMLADGPVIIPATP